MWPESLVEELASRRGIIFLGAGASAGSLNNDTPPSRPPTWSSLLSGLKDMSGNEAVVAAAEALITKEKYLDAAEVLMNDVNEPDFASFIRDTFVSPRFSESKVHEIVLEIDPKIVITTNYDDIYESYCKVGGGQGLYNVCKYYETHLVSDLRSPVRQIIKAHGCVSDPSKVVLTRSQYFKAKQEYSSFYKVLDALFLTNTLLFIGYGLSDPDIQILLENTNIVYKTSHPHYALIEAGMNPSLKAAYTKSYNIQFIEFPQGDYDAALSALSELNVKVLEKRASNPS